VRISTVTPPTQGVLSLKETKEHLRIPLADKREDSYVTGLIKSATSWAEGFLNRSLVSRTLKMTLDGFYPEISLPLPPVSEISSVTYYDVNNVEQTLAADQYQLVADDPSPLMIPAYNVIYPGTYPRTDAVFVTFVAGYGVPDDVPDDIKHGMLIAISDMYEHRESEIVGVMVMQMPITTAQKLLWPNRVMY